jgi:hypothetical protein
MRLLEFRHNTVQLYSFEEHEIPPYAILSHTWGNDEDEVKFQDVTNGSGKGRLGYRKIEFCAKQAAADQLGFFWVDTCCINKSSSSELAEAITSMFRWYQKAAKCYVYLPDVLAVGHHQSSQSPRPWEAELRKSRWFTRGWTLQELIAPKEVEFYSAEGEYLGSKMSLEDLLHEITGISVDVLRDGALSKVSDHEKFQWVQNRQTKRPEDMVYSLLGIFDVSLVMQYGEGEHHARHRLEEAIKTRGPLLTNSPDIHINPLEVGKIIHDAWISCMALLSDKERDDFKEVHVEHVKWTVFNIQREKESKKSMMSCQRLKGFLEGMSNLVKISGSLLDVDRYAAYVWGPMKFMLLVRNVESNIYHDSVTGAEAANR